MNRLLPIPGEYLANYANPRSRLRAAIGMELAVRAGRATWVHGFSGRYEQLGRDLPPVGELLREKIGAERLFGAVAWQRFADVVQNPTEEEREDLEFSNGLFKPGPLAGVRFFHKRGTAPHILPYGVPSAGTHSPWREIRLPARNVSLIFSLMFAYPWPGAMFGRAYADLHPDVLRQLASHSEELTADQAKSVLTLTLLADWENVVNRVEHLVAEKVAKKKRLAIVRAGVVSVASILVGAAFGGAVLLVAKAALQQIDERQQHQLAESLAKMAASFDEDAPAFASEVRRTLAWVKAQEARPAPAAPPVAEILPHPPIAEILPPPPVAEQLPATDRPILSDVSSEVSSIPPLDGSPGAGAPVVSGSATKRPAPSFIARVVLFFRALLGGA